MSVSVSASTAKRLTVLPSNARTSTSSRALSIAIYLHDLAGGGVERQSLIIAEEFRRHGADVTMVLHRLRGQLLDHLPAGLRTVDLNSSRTMTDIPKLAHFFRTEKPDILLSNVDMNNIAALIAKAVSFSRTKVVICQHNPFASNFVRGEPRLYKHVSAMYRLLAPMISRAVAVSSGVAAELDAAGVPADRIVTIHNPVVGPDFQARSEEAVDHPWFHEQHRPVFVTAGRLVLQKDHGTLIRALAIHRQRFDSRLIILGTGPLDGALAELVEQLNLQASVEFLGFQSNALPYIKRADAFVLSSRCEGFGNVLVEALGCGTPVISTRCNHGPAEILEDGRYGMLVQTRNPAALAAAMDQVATLRERFPADILRQRAEEFSYAACASRYMAMFKALAPHCVWAA